MHMSRRTVIGLDFDGTVVEDHFPNIGEPLPHAIRVLQRMCDAGMILVLWSCREDDELKDAIQFCANRGINVITPSEYDMMIKGPLHKCRRKVPADYYIDDRNIFCSAIDWLDIEYLFFGDAGC